jgi:hypothetical protein
LPAEKDALGDAAAAAAAAAGSAESPAKPGTSNAPMCATMASLSCEMSRRSYDPVKEMPEGLQHMLHSRAFDKSCA